MHVCVFDFFRAFDQFLHALKKRRAKATKRTAVLHRQACPEARTALAGKEYTLSCVHKVSKTKLVDLSLELEISMYLLYCSYDSYEV